MASSTTKYNTEKATQTINLFNHTMHILLNVPCPNKPRTHFFLRALSLSHSSSSVAFNSNLYIRCSQKKAERGKEVTFFHSVHRQLVLFDAIMRFDDVSSVALVFLSARPHSNSLHTLHSASWFNSPLFLLFLHFSGVYVLRCAPWFSRLFHSDVFFSWMYPNTWQTSSICRFVWRNTFFGCFSADISKRQLSRLSL